MDTIPDSLKPAFLIYIKEVEDHIVYFHSLLNREPADLFADDFLAIHHRCHTIKGGAGFFKLSKLQDLGADGEKFYATYDNAGHAISYLKSLTERLERAFNELK